MSRCHFSVSRAATRTLPSVCAIVLAFLVLAPLSAQAQFLRGEAKDGALSCNPRIELAATGRPFFLGDKVHIQANIGAGSIQGGDNILIEEFKYALDCAVGQSVSNCVTEGNLVTLDDLNITTNCVNAADAPVTWQVSEANVRTFTPVGGLPVVVPENSTCRIEFDVSVEELNGQDNLVRQLLGWTAQDAACDNGLVAQANSSVNITIQECGLDMTKEVSVDGGATWHDANKPGIAPVLEVGGDAMYRLSVQNTGSVGYVEPISIVDAALGIDTTIPPLAAGASTVIDGNTIPALNVEDRCSKFGFVQNVSEAEGFCRVGDDPVGASDSDIAWVQCVPAPVVQIRKEISLDGKTWYDANTPGKSPVAEYPSGAEYRITISNPGPGGLDDVVFNDATLGVSDHALGSLGVGGSIQLTSANIGALGVAERCAGPGTFNNIATADAVSAMTGEPVPQASDPANLVCIAPPEIDIVKEISVDGGGTWLDANSPATAPVLEYPGSAEYRLTVTNTGSTDLVNVVVNDAILGIANHAVGNLAAGASVVLDSDEIGALGVAERCDAAATITNTASADGNSAETGTPAAQATDPAVLVCVGPAAIEVLKEISVDGGKTWHDANSGGTAPVVEYPSGAEYRVTVSNPGPVDLVDVVVNDATLGITDHAVGNLSVGDNVVIDSGQLAALSVAQVCDEAGTFLNTALADGNSAETGDPASQASDPANLVCVDPPVIEVLKEISVDGGSTWEDANSAVSAPIVTFPSGAEYRISVSNPGPTDLVDVVVNDGDLGISDFAVGDLDAGDSVVLDSGDIAALSVAQVCDASGEFTNTATADGNSAETATAALQASDPAVLVCIGSADITLLKEISVDGGQTWHDADDLNTAAIAVFPSPALYRLTVTNSGTSPLTGVTVDDPDLGIDDHPVGDLDPGESVVLTEAEIPVLNVSVACGQRGTFVNNATATGTSTEDLSQVNDTDPAYLVCVGEPHLSLVKEISVDGGSTWYNDEPPPQTFPSDALYRISVTNDGTAPLEDVTVDDATLGVTDYFVGDLAVGETVVLTESEIPELFFEDRCTSGGEFMNTASASGTSVDFPYEEASDSDMANLVCIGDPMVSLEKEISVDGGQNYVDADDVNTAAVAVAPVDAMYRLIVRNIGPVPLTNIEVSDPTLGIVGFPVADLAVGGEVTIDAGTIKALFVPGRCTNVGTFLNTASVSAESADGTPTTDSDPAWLSCVGSPDIRIVKEISTNGGTHWFDDSSTAELPPANALYRLTVTNTGTSDLDDVEVSDATLGIAGFPVGFLGTGNTIVLTHKDIPALSTTNRCTSPGEYVNTASTSGVSLDFPFETVNDSDPAMLVCIEAGEVCAPDKPKVLTVQYDGDSDTSHNQDSSEVIIDPANAVFTNTVYIEVYGHINDLIATHANVVPGYVFDVVGPQPRIPPRLTFLIYSGPGGELLQTVQFHSSCSEPLQTGDEFGAITIIDGIN